ncbi:MAG: Holliday junction resolvase RuvX [Chloroflexi bacterium]|nr:Holliday junction resolvase RuvX [Chloroflexota bacterium]
MTTWLALDIGDKRIGLAVGNSAAWLARPHSIVVRRSKRADAAEIARVAAHEGADALLVGLPYNMDGSEGPQAKRVRNYARQLITHVPLPMQFVDERLSSFAADQILQQNRPRKPGGKKRHNDDVAAAVFLQAFLDQQRSAVARAAADHSS